MLYIGYNGMVSKLKNAFVEHFCQEVKLKGNPSLI